MPTRIKIATALTFIVLVSGCTADTDNLDLPRMVGLPIEVTATEKPGLDQAPQDQLRAEVDEARDLDEGQPEEPAAPSVLPEENTRVEPEPIVTEEPSDPYSIAKVAYKEARLVIDGSATASSDNLLASENLPQAYGGMLLSNLSNAFSMWDERYGVVDGYRVVAFTYADGAWADEQLSRIGATVPYGSWTAYLSARSDQGKNCWLASAFPTSFHICMALDPSLAKLQAIDAAHEYFHSIQNKIGLNHANIPVWIGEGSATYFGTVAGALGYRHTLDSAKHWQTYQLAVTVGGSGIGEYVHNMSSEDMIMIFESLEVGMTEESMQPMQDYAGYQLGSLATEFLVGSYGYENYMSFLDKVGAGTNWKTAFNSSFNMSTTQFYVNMLEYLQEVY